MEAKRHKTNEASIDRFSGLPDSLIHHILSFLPIRLVVGLSFLSKQWRYMWTSTPLLCFDSSDHQSFGHGKLAQRRFQKFVGNCLKHHQRINQNLHFSTSTTLPLCRFVFKMRLYSGNKAFFDRCVRYAAENSNEFELIILPALKKRSQPNWDYFLPDILCNSKSLTVLKLSSMVLNSSFVVTLPSLKSLGLCQVRVNDETFYKMVLGCPALEELSIESCTDLLNVRISSLNLRSFVHENFLFHRNPDISIQKLNLVSQKTLESLSLVYVNFGLNDKLLEDLIGGLPVLQHLTLSSCFVKHSRQINVFSQQMKSFVLKRPQGNSEIEINIDTPKLVSFCYEGPMLSNVLFINAPKLVDTKLTFLDEKYETEWYYDLINFLQMLDCAGSLSLQVQSAEV